MTVHLPETLEKLLDLLKAKGVARFKTEEVLIELYSASGPPQELMPQGEAPSPEPDWCACGHSLGIAHGDAGCLYGCDTSKCQSAKPTVNPP
jgi:hypothetical protein